MDETVDLPTEFDVVVVGSGECLRFFPYSSPPLKVQVEVKNRDDLGFPPGIFVFFP